MPTETVPELPTPPDADELYDWSQSGPELLKRPFTGTVREAAGFMVRVEGVHWENGTCSRRVVVVASSLQTQLELEAVRQLAAALSAAADEIEALR
ncbi:hypothetical protein [Mycobacterium sp.]|uniref:hypothetical protein n=1 Tax=Mycobacterium sp. TaxID=1785 RepID=UPI0025D5F2F7|nr:hypothetical protein [Mycobacterium sp.]